MNHQEILYFAKNYTDFKDLIEVKSDQLSTLDLERYPYIHRDFHINAISGENVFVSGKNRWDDTEIFNFPVAFLVMSDEEMAVAVENARDARLAERKRKEEEKRITQNKINEKKERLEYERLKKKFGE